MAYVSANWGEEPYLQTKNTTVTPSANWSGAETNAATITPDSGYDAMEKVNVKVPMLRDYTLMTVSQAETPSTVYNGNTAQSNSAKMLRVAPTKDGMSYTNSYLEVPASSAMGNATVEDVASGKTFSSSAGIAVTGTGQMAQDIKRNTLFTTKSMVTNPVYYDGDTEVQGSGNFLKIDTTKDGVVKKSPLTYEGYILGASAAMGDAAASDVLKNKICSSMNGIGLKGTIETRSASSETISGAKTYQAGYYPNGWTVTPQGSADPVKMYDTWTRASSNGDLIMFPDGIPTEGYGHEAIYVVNINDNENAGNILIYDERLTSSYGYYIFCTMSNTAGGHVHTVGTYKETTTSHRIGVKHEDGKLYISVYATGNSNLSYRTCCTVYLYD